MMIFPQDDKCHLSFLRFSIQLFTILPAPYQFSKRESSSTYLAPDTIPNTFYIWYHSILREVYQVRFCTRGVLHTSRVFILHVNSAQCRIHCEWQPRVWKCLSPGHHFPILLKKKKVPEKSNWFSSPEHTLLKIESRSVWLQSLGLYL